MTVSRFPMTVLVFFAAIGLRADDRSRADEKPKAELSVAEFTQLFQQLHVKNQPWAAIGWKVSLTEARQIAAKEKKPIFLVVNTGNCLGWT